MQRESTRLNFAMARLIILPAIFAAVLGFVLSRNATVEPVQAFSSGPPPGYTGAPGEEPEACAECHLSPGDPGQGHISITAPTTYLPGQTYQITVTHTNPDPTRMRWGFELTALDPADEKAGNLQSTSAFTQVIQGGPGGNRQYIEHTSSGTFINQQGGASWTFNWAAPATDVGTVTFYAAGNHANSDGNTSGDYIYRTFVSSASSASPPQLKFEQGGVDPNQAAALDSVLLLRDPFRIRSAAEWLNLGADRNTRVIVFAANLSLNPGETAAAVVVNLIDANNQSYDVAAEDVRPVANSDLSQITFRLPDNLAVGTCSVKVKIHGLVSNAGNFRIAP
jgi:hypothetical protein